MMHQGDLFDVLPTLAEASMEACVTDPPYGIGFMGREWDTFKPGTGKHRKLMHPRERIASANPNIDGRHRSPALSPSQIDYDYSTAGLRGFQHWTEQWAREVHRVLKPGAYLVVCGAPRSHHRMMCGLEDAGFVVRDCFAWLFGSGFPKNYNLGDGKGTALKPAHEPIALAWKPFKGTIKACHATHGTAALNIDACRIGDEVETWPKSRAKPADGFPNAIYTHRLSGQTETQTVSTGDAPSGRWPANVLLDDEAAALLDEQTGELHSGGFPQTRNVDKFKSVYGAFRGGDVDPDAMGASVGGASRFYYVAKPSREERDYGLYGEASRGGAEQFDSRWKEGTGENRKPLVRNGHPTVKPVELMRWLVKLVTPIGGTVLDPFTGSGTTGMACKYEQRGFVGIEKEPAYFDIAQRRIAAVTPLFTEAS